MPSLKLSPGVNVASLVRCLVSGKCDNVCRICYGNTEDGAINLCDTVLLDRPYCPESVTLAEILTAVAGSDVIDQTLPRSLCITCANSAIQSFAFQQFCRNSTKTLTTMLHLISQEHSITSDPLTMTAYCIIKNNMANIISDTCRVESYDDLLKRLDYFDNTLAAKTLQIKTECLTTPMSQNHKVYCTLCSQGFKMHCMLNSHVDRVHREKKIQCPNCPKLYGSKKLMMNHKAMMHMPGKCKICGKEYTNRPSLRAHMQTHMSTDGTCHKCGKLYRNTQSLKNHLKFCVEGERKEKYICIECGQVYSTKYSLLSHNKMEHSENPYKCDYCGKKFIDRGKLKCHISTHTGIKHYQCKICKAYFKFSNTLVYHMRALHTGDRPFACQICDKTFITSAKRLAHMRMHHGASGPKCEACHKIFPTGQKLNLHLKRVHKVGIDKSDLTNAETDEV